MSNPYMPMGFFKFLISAVLIAAFFPFSVLFCLIFWGFDDTVLYFTAVFHKFLKVVFAILKGILILLVLGFIVEVITYEAPLNVQIQRSAPTDHQG
jgi:uncharacterized protein involved in cysteine biosynthesis